MPGNLAGHPWHHYMAGGPASLLELVPFLLLVLLFVLLAAGSWGRRQADALPSKRKPPAVSPPALTSDTHTVRPVLASDLEREEATRLVSHAVGEGRLSFEEGGRRIDEVLCSRHRHELAGLVADLPSPVSAATARPLTSTLLRPGLLAVSAAVVLAAVLVQAVVGLWELWPLAVVGLGTSALLRRR
jgi:hypothetical protein